MSNNLIKSVNKVSKLFQPAKVIPKGAPVKLDDGSKSYRLMVDMGIIRQANPGMYALLPMGYRAFNKLVSIVDSEMQGIGAQKMLLSNLTNVKLWEQSGRLQEMNPELFKLKDRHSVSFILSPTHEEAITQLIGSVGSVLKKQLPLLLYQISSKWRDEMRPKLGLLRSREFIMKDLYSFDLTTEDAEQTYMAVTEAYKNIFSRIGLSYEIALGDPGMMGGSSSHEYHYISNHGEDTILSCPSCKFTSNLVMIDGPTCKNCNTQLVRHQSIEVGHTFLLGTKYSDTFSAICHTHHSKTPLVMGCYGLGLTRILAAATEIMSTNEELRWPTSIAPFTVCVIPPKENTKQAAGANEHANKIIEFLLERNLDFIVDDRTDLTIGKRMIDCRRTGYPFVIIVGKAAIESTPTFELHDLNNSQQMDLSMDQLFSFFDHSNDKQAMKQVL